MPAQDDEREIQMRQLFNLTKAGGRSDVDALLELSGRDIPELLRGRTVEFELKSATRGKATISTVRDFGLHYVEKWSRLHWLFGIYGRNSQGDQELQYCLYGSPEKMRPWFDRMAAYIAPDVALAACVPSLITDVTLTAVLGDADSFAAEDAKRLMKNQYRAVDYVAAADLGNGRFSRRAMLRLLQQRCGYVIQRGSTLNNPHIPASHFAGWLRITSDHAATLRDLVVEALENEPPHR
jgi:hypothetical protein